MSFVEFTKVLTLWVSILMIPLVLGCFSIPLFLQEDYWQSAIILLGSIGLGWRNYHYEITIMVKENEIARMHKQLCNYHIVPIKAVSVKVNEEIENYFATKKIKTKKVFILERNKPKGPDNEIVKESIT